MSRRIAAIFALLAFAVSLLMGAFRGDNTFETIVSRALLVMAATFVVGLLVGWMAQKMLDENDAAKNLKNSETKVEPTDR